MQNKTNDKDLSSLLEDIKLELLGYVNKRIKYLKLDSFEKGSIVASSIGYSLIVAIIAGTIIFFSLLGLAFFLGELLDSQAAGFGVLALFSLLILIVVLICRKRLKSFLLNKTITFLNKLDKNETE